MVLVFALPISLLHEFVHYVLALLFQKPLRWEWDNAGNPDRRRIDLFNSLHFPRDFLWGTATAAHQIEGGNTNNNWHKWETTPDEHGKSRIKHGHKSGRAADHWNRVPEDVALMKNLNCNSYRMSIEWSRIEPKEGVFDKQALKHYSDEIDLLLKNDIVPMVTLHHFTQPLWFDELGGFEKEENLEYFIRFSEYVFQEFHTRVPFWCTINEPTVFSMVGWLQGSFPPGKRAGASLAANIDDAVNVLCNLLRAHVRVFKALKAIDPKPEIGIVHNIFQTRPFRRWHPLDYASALIADDLQNNLVIQFMRTGKFSFRFPVGGKHFVLDMPEATKAFDFFGLNYYSHMFYRFHFSLSDPIRAEAHPEDAYSGVMTDMEYPMYAEGFYQALKRLSEAFPGVPLYVTENGVADDDDSRQLLFVKRYVYAMSQAIKEGVNLKGYFYWTLMDNFEWAFGYTMRFGLYSVDYGENADGENASFDRKIRPGGVYLKKVIGRFAHHSHSGEAKTPVANRKKAQ